VLRDRTQRVFARPENVHRIRHDGRYFQIEAIHLSEPSPQRTALIYQAGASSRGRQFAATHAECVFISGQVPQYCRSAGQLMNESDEAAPRRGRAWTR
jgi:long-chain alkane monooxygenase